LWRINEAQVQRLTTPQELATLLTRYPGRRTSQLTPERGASRAFEQDRDADLLNAGFSTLRITNRRLKEQQAREARRLEDILRSRSS
jgi:hypothetical protein